MDANLAGLLGAIVAIVALCRNNARSYRIYSPSWLLYLRSHYYGLFSLYVNKSRYARRGHNHYKQNDKRYAQLEHSHPEYSRVGHSHPELDDLAARVKQLEQQLTSLRAREMTDLKEVIWWAMRGAFIGVLIGAFLDIALPRRYFAVHGTINYVFDGKVFTEHVSLPDYWPMGGIILLGIVVGGLVGGTLCWLIGDYRARKALATNQVEEA